MFFKVENLSKYFFGVAAVDNVCIEVAQGELVGLIGPNGSGKTTFFNCISGFLRSERGKVFFQGREVTNLPPHRIARLGISRTFQEVRIFSKLTVLENMLASIQEYQDFNPLARFARTGHVLQLEKEGQERALELLDMVSLTRFRDEPADHLSYGQRKLLGFAAALMSEPEHLLLDEPAAGVNLTTIEQMKQHIRAVNARGTTVLLVEHNMDVVMNLCQRIIVLDHGEKIAEGPPNEIQNDERVLEAYFGK
jgi:ABC-type branched-subunit amino acid transport system ATPase component